MPQDYKTLATLRSKHFTENPAAITTDKARSKQRAGITAVGKQEQQSDVTTERLDIQGQLPEIENLFGKATENAPINQRQLTERDRSVWTTLQPSAGYAGR